MNRLLLVLAASLALSLLAACNPTVPQVQGELLGDWSDLGNVDVALVGLTEEGQLSFEDQPQIVDATVTKGYNLSLPATAPAGAYKVVAFVDENGDSQYQASEAKGDSGDKRLIWSDSDVAAAGLKEGWNGQEGASAPTQVNVYSNYDIARY